MGTPSAILRDSKSVRTKKNLEWKKNMKSRLNKNLTKIDLKTSSFS